MAWIVLITSFGATQTFTVMEAESVLYVQVFRDEDALFSGMSHDHVVRAGNIAGTIEVDPEAPATCKGRVVVPVASLVVDEPAWRRKVGYEVMLDDDDRNTVREHMLQPDGLDGARFKEILFVAEACAEGPAKDATLAGSMTIRGRTHTLEVPLQVELLGEILRVRGEVTIRHADYGMEPFTAFLGAVGNREEILLHIELVARRAGPRP